MNFIKTLIKMKQHIAGFKYQLFQARDNVVGQKMLLLHYNAMRNDQKLTLRDVGFGIYSQHDEDGILLYIFSRIGMATRKSVEICAGNGIECNTANLLINHRWTGLLIDGSEKNIAMARNYYASRTETKYWPPDILSAWVTRENVNELLRMAGYSGVVDLLSMDLDGVDYWVWEALTEISPRVVVLEYNHLLGAEASLSIPYQPDFLAEFTEYGSDYAGASLKAFVKLGERKGYRFIGTNAIGTNAFFIQEDIGIDLFPKAAIEDAFQHPRAEFGTNVRYEKIKNKEWVEV